MRCLYLTFFGAHTKFTVRYSGDDLRRVFAFVFRKQRHNFKQGRSKMATTVLITGGCGFVGSNLAVFLATRGMDVVCLDNFSRRGSEYLAERVISAGCRVVRGDVRCPEDLAKIAGADVLVECSAEPSVLVGSRGGDARYLMNVNLVGALNCFEWAREHRSGVVFMSTSRVYPIHRIHSAKYRESETRFQLVEAGQGLSSQGVSVDCPLDGVRSLYGASKLAAEIVLAEYSAAYDLPCIINRCGVIAGPWQLGKVDQGVFTYWLANHYFKKPLKYIGFGGSGKQVRDLLHVDDLCDLIGRQIQALPNHRAERFNVGGGLAGSLSLMETTGLCREITGNVVEISSEATERPFDLPWYVTDNGNTGEVFGWTPQYTPQDILVSTYEWLKAHEQAFSKVFNG